MSLSPAKHLFRLELGTFWFYLLKYIDNSRRIRIKGSFLLYIHSSYLYKKVKEKNAFYIIIILSFCWFIVKYLISTYVNSQFCYLLYIAFSFFSFFSFSVHVNMPKLHKNIEQLYILLFRNFKNRITLTQCLIEKSRVQTAV